LERVTKLYRKSCDALEETKSEQVKLYAQTAQLQKQFDQLKADKANEIHQLQLNLQSLERQRDAEKQELNARLSQQQQIVKKSEQEMDQLLSTQQKMAMSWKDEAKAMADNYEKLIHDLKNQLDKTTQRYEETNAGLVRSNVLKEELSQQLTQEKQMQARLHQMVKAAESKAQESARQVQDLLVREQELLNEKKYLRASTLLLFRLTFNFRACRRSIGVREGTFGERESG